MDYSSTNELNSIISDLGSVIEEMESLSDCLRRNFEGIGSEKCAHSIDVVMERYYGVKRKLNNVDTSKVVKGFEKK